MRVSLLCCSLSACILQQDAAWQPESVACPCVRMWKCVTGLVCERVQSNAVPQLLQAASWGLQCLIKHFISSGPSLDLLKRSLWPTANTSSWAAGFNGPWSIVQFVRWLWMLALLMDGTHCISWKLFIKNWTTTGPEERTHKLNIIQQRLGRIMNFIILVIKFVVIKKNDL